MARLKWGSRKKKYIETGVSHGILFPVGSKGVPWDGLTSISESSSGAEPIDLYADNQKYCTFRSAESYEATIEAYTYPDEFAECDGSVEIAQATKIGQQPRKSFHLCFRTDLIDGNGDTRLDGYKIHLVYNATASPAEKSYETINESPDAVTFSWNINTIPFYLEDYKATSKIVIDTTKADWISVKELEDIIYGTEDKDPRMPEPDEVLSILQRLDVKRIFMDVVNKFGFWKWDTFNFRTDTIPLAIERESSDRVIFDPEAGTTYVSPSIAYTLIETDSNGRRKYDVYAITDTNPSEFISSLESAIEMTKLGVTQSGGMYYHRYNLYVNKGDK